MRLSIATAMMRAVASQSPAQIADIVALRDLVERQVDRIDELEQVAGIRFEPPTPIALSPTERRLLGALMKASPSARNADVLVALLWGDLPECDQPNDPRKVLKVHVYNLRRVLAGYGVEIETSGLGPSLAYRIPRAGKALIEGMRDGA